MPYVSMAGAVSSSSSSSTTGGHPNFSSFFTQILGGYYATAFVRGIEFGVVCTQAWYIFRSISRRREKPFFRLLVAWMTMVALLQTILSIYRAYYMLIIHFADFTTALTLTWAGKINFVLDTLMIIPSQAFFLWRYWIVSMHNRRLSLCLVVLFAGCLSSAIAETQKVAGKTVSHSPNDPYFIPYIIFPAVLNTSLSACLLWTYLRTESQRKRRFIASDQLSVIIWDACLPPTICAWALVITYFASGTFDFWPSVLHGVKGQLGAITFIIAFQRRHIHQQRTQGHSTNSSGLGTIVSRVDFDHTTELILSTRRDSAAQHEAEIIELRTISASKSMNTQQAPSGAFRTLGDGGDGDRSAAQEDLQTSVGADVESHAHQP